MAVLRNGLKCIAHPAFSGTPLFHRFAPCPNLIFEIGSKIRQGVGLAV
jgi:hypothetical protein